MSGDALAMKITRSGAMGADVERVVSLENSHAMS